MDGLTEPVGTKHEPRHVDDWLDGMPDDFEDEGECYARWWLEQARWPAWKKSYYARLMRDRLLFCTYKGERMRCTGASRLGDVWLARDHKRSAGYDLRVNVEDCTAWGPSP